MQRAQQALITGSSGFVGSHLLEYLLEATDWDIVCMIRWRSPLDNLQDAMARPDFNDRVRFVYADLKDSDGLRAMVMDTTPDYVFHLAAQSYPVTSFTMPVDTIDTNTNGTVRLLEALRAHWAGAKIHICSSSEVYGRVPAAEVPIKETTRFHPASPYAISKAGADLAAQHYAEAYAMRIIVTRMFTHTGPRRGDVFAESSFAKQLAMAERSQVDCVMHGNLESLRTVADVRDAVRAYVMALTVRPRWGEVYNIGGNKSLTVGEILAALENMAEVRVPRHLDPSRLRPLDADLQVPDCTKFKRDTGWEPRIPFTQTMLDLLDYWRARLKVQRVLLR